jgi:hypothetical protein
MWGCCGKTERNAPGCNISRHISKEEEDDDYHKNEEDGASDKFMRCSVSTRQSCKEVGHAPKDCPKDPNIKTMLEIEEERDRVSKHSKVKRRVADCIA